ncbi:short chain enoyl-CoA hydratase /enoyl-CoA hydratase [Scopulibacillus darangshiensis]|uniref:Short chain enoyl-CoA hydratase /enoyl-CoA hydratase n=1 Tax=Scopulibacillus darangshiensis TaxID=442528 RepID=A0A4R2P396_9BACL|nr:enoyl-CoA hydratase-related protein [Scopulibacillus darangshiensis]TCP29249.1 short chain enoyl-CoA hydratase /enoyl-CoA hydratase [Scopulibacillus darangshiensis]
METVAFEVENHVAWVTLDRPDRLNAFNDQMNRDIIAAIKRAEKDDDIRAVVITGAGRAFCSGEDLSGVQEDANFGDILRKRYNPMVQRLAKFEKPLIAAVNGTAAGAGMSLALACDFRLASEKASFIEAFIHVGLVPDSGNLYYLPRLVGYAKALELAVLGEKVSAEEALNLGLVTKVLPHDDYNASVQAFAEKLAGMPTKAIGLIKRYMRQSFETNLDQMLENEAFAQRTAGQTADHQAGIQAFLSKSKPAFTGK